MHVSYTRARDYALNRDTISTVPQIPVMPSRVHVTCYELKAKVVVGNVDVLILGLSNPDQRNGLFGKSYL